MGGPPDGRFRSRNANRRVLVQSALQTAVLTGGVGTLRTFVGIVGTSGNGGAGFYQVMTNTSAQIFAASSFNCSPLTIYTEGYIDRRGRDA